jgi:hypothetical protein
MDPIDGVDPGFPGIGSKLQEQRTPPLPQRHRQSAAKVWREE